MFLIKRRKPKMLSAIECMEKERKNAERAKKIGKIFFTILSGVIVTAICYPIFNLITPGLGIIAIVILAPMAMISYYYQPSDNISG